MGALTYKQLLATPPALKKHTATLPDGREYVLHQLPLGALDKIAKISRESEKKNRDLDWSEFGEMASQSLLGRKPKAKEVSDLIDALGTDTVMHIYKDAIRVSQLGSEAIDKAKKS